MGTLVFRELYNLLLAAKKFERFQPSTKKILLQSMAVHLYAGCFALIPLIDAFYIPKATPSTGCEPIPVNKTQHVFFWVFFCPATILIPGSFAIFICFKIWKEELLPASGAKRALLFYFARLIVLIFTLTVAILVAFSFKGWTQAVAFIFFNLTGLVQVILALLKKDVKVACSKLFYKLINCRCNENEDNQESTQHSSNQSNDEDNPERKSSTYGFDRIISFISRKSQRLVSNDERSWAQSSTDGTGESQFDQEGTKNSDDNSQFAPKASTLLHCHVTADSSKIKYSSAA